MKFTVFSAIENRFGKPCKFIPLDHLTSFYPADKKFAILSKDLKNYWAIKRDLKKCDTLIGEILKVQTPDRLLVHPHLFSAGWFHCVTLYARWFKSTEGRPTLSDQIFDGKSNLLDIHKHFITLRDKYVAHFQEEIMGKTELFFCFDLAGEFLELTPLTTEIYVSEKADIFDLSKLVKFVFYYVSDEKIPKLEKALHSHIETLPDCSKIHEAARTKEHFWGE